MSLHKSLTVSVRYPETEKKEEYLFERTEYGGYVYGNGSAVVIHKDGAYHDVVDTRYDKTVTYDFDSWCENYLAHTIHSDFQGTPIRKEN